MTTVLELYRLVFKQFSEKLGWSTQFFQVQCDDPQKLTNTFDKNLLIGISYNKVSVCRKFNSINIFEYSILDFNYRISGDCLFIENGENLYKFYGNSWVFFDYLFKVYKTIAEMENRK